MSYGEYDKAVEFYEKSLTMPGVDAGESLTRLGIAQVGMENFSAAQGTFGKITGMRSPLARVWAGYAAFKGGAGAASSATATSDEGPSLQDLMSASS